MRILVTGGAGFVGSNLASFFKRDRPDATVVAFDNLRRRGSELALSRLRAAGVEFRHGDVRNAEDLAEAGDFDLMIECSAEPSVHAGYGASPAYVINTNLTGTINCLEAVRRCGAALVFLSTSRVYPIAGLRALPLTASPASVWRWTRERPDRDGRRPASARVFPWPAAGRSMAPPSWRRN